MHVEQAILGHLQYLGRVEDYVKGRSEGVALSSPSECLLGRWLAEQAPGDWQELRANHERFHALAESAVQAKQDGKQAEAEKLLQEMYVLFGRIEHLLLQVP